MTEDILLQVKKPAQYIGGEWNVSKKDFDKAYLTFALCFPDLYEVGMSNLGIRILYGILNGIDDVSCERFFASDLDMQEVLRSANQKLSSLESKRPLRDFDLVGFSLSYELCYTTVLAMLDQGGMPLRADERDHTYPLVIGGGPCALNPEPMHEFFDFFVLGEAEEVILEILEVYRRYKEQLRSKKITKQEVLIAFAQIEGVYVPSLYEVAYSAGGQLESYTPNTRLAPATIKKRIVRSLDQAYFPLAWLVPYVQIIHDRIMVEVMRGCPHHCRFCQARSQYYPFRIRQPQKIVQVAKDAYRSSGYEEISLTGLSVSDYPGLDELSKSMVQFCTHSAVSLSFPSIRPYAHVADLSTLIATIKKTGLTFAPEAASVRLRTLLAKDFEVETFFSVLREVYRAGYFHVKLYFMIGLPQETQEDVDAIVDFAQEVSLTRKQVGKPAAEVHVSVNTLIPKPHTPFQWLGMEPLLEIERKQQRLKDKVKKYKKIKIHFHNSQMSVIEAILCRGDRRLSKAVASAYYRSAHFQGWENHFNFSVWQAALQEHACDPSQYLKAKSRHELLPWDSLDLGIRKEKLLSEAEEIKLVAGKEDRMYNITPNR